MRRLSNIPWAGERQGALRLVERKSLNDAFQRSRGTVRPIGRTVLNYGSFSFFDG
jgi:hypothetical protein